MTELGILDLGHCDQFDTIDIAQDAEEAGYERIWLAQHFESRSYTNPLLMTGLVAGSTDRIRVGPAGVLLRYYAPYAVVDDALFLEQTFPGRIDLGLAASVAPAQLRDQLNDGRQTSGAEYLHRKIEDVGALASVRFVDGLRPHLWVLGSRGERAQLAAKVGASYCLSLLHTKERPAPSVLDGYRRACADAGRPGHCSILVGLVCAETTEQAEALADPALLEFSPGVIIGSLERCRATLEELREQYRAEEVVVAHCHASAVAMRWAVRELAVACGLRRSQPTDRVVSRRR